MKKVCMVVQDRMVKGGIAAVINGYYGSKLEQDYRMLYVESYKDGNRITKLFKAIKGYLQFAKILILEKPDIVHIHSSFGPSFYRKLPFIYMASWAEIPIINHIHGADFSEFYTTAGIAKKRLVCNVYRKCGKLIALSDEWKERLSELVSKEKIVVVENYSILNKSALDEKLGRKSNYTVLFLGELGKRKGCYDIPFIVEQVVKVIPDVKVILAGAGSTADETKIKRSIWERGVLEHVVFPGWIRGEEKDRFLREADVFLLPTYNEGMPMSVLDAMGYALPIISTKVGGIPKIVYDGKNGYCCNPGDIDSMAEHLIHLLSDDCLRKNMGSASYKIIEKKYSLDQHIRKLESLYEEVLKKSIVDS